MSSSTAWRSACLPPSTFQTGAQHTQASTELHYQHARRDISDNLRAGGMCRRIGELYDDILKKPLSVDRPAEQAGPAARVLGAQRSSATVTHRRRQGRWGALQADYWVSASTLAHVAVPAVIAALVITFYGARQRSESPYCEPDQIVGTRSERRGTVLISLFANHTAAQASGEVGRSLLLLPRRHSRRSKVQR